MLDDFIGAGNALFERVVILSPLTVSAATSVSDTIAKMHQARSSYAIVVEQLALQPKKQRLLGLFTERDLVRAIASEQSFDELPIANVMSTQTPTVLKKDVTSAVDLFTQMRQHNVRALPVVSDNNQLSGIITKQSLRQSLTAPSLLKFKLVADVMTTQVVCIPQTETVICAAQLMASRNISCVVASGDDGLPTGVITERDIVQFKALGLDIYATCVQQVMSTPLLPVSTQDSLWLTHQLMNQYRVRRLVVCTKEGHIAGLITQDSILEALDSEDSQQLVTLLQQEIMQLRAENQTLLEARNQELERAQLRLSNRLEHKQIEQQKTKADLEAAYFELEKSHNTLTSANKELEEALKELQSTEQKLQQTNLELKGTVEHRTSDLLRAEGRWRNLLEEVHLVVIGLDIDGKVNYANPFFLRLTGYSAEEVLEKYWFVDFIPDNEREHTYQYFQTFIDDREIPLRYQNAILTRSGSTRMIVWHNVTLRDRANRIVGTMSIGEDITDRLVVDQMKGEFVSVVSHELRTPLTAIHGSLNLITSGLIASDSLKGQELLQVAAESSQKLVSLVNDVLELERLESGKAQLNRGKVASQTLTSQVARTFKVAADNKEIVLEICDPGLALMADGDRLMQVLTNLLDNAIKFSPKNASIQLSVERQHSSNTREPLALFRVRDEGRGIPSEDLSEIFERFTQVNYADSREMGGTGLGLAICHNIIHQHGGEIWVESRLGEGSCFSFTVPLFTQ